MKRVLFFILIFGLMSRTVSACSCVMGTYDQLLYSYNNSDVIFSGMVTKIEDDPMCAVNQKPSVDTDPSYEIIQANDDSGCHVLVKLKVLEGFKGVDTSELTIDTGPLGDMCRYMFEENTEYLVYAILKDNQYFTMKCHRTGKLSSASSDLQALRETQLPDWDYQTWSEKYKPIDYWNLEK